MVDIKEFKRDDSRDYLVPLRALNEIPFPVGKKLLVDFLYGDMNNPSITKNKMYELNNFESLRFLGKEKINEIIERLITNKLIDLSPSVFNKYIKVLGISVKGQQELISPNIKKTKDVQEYEVKISKREKEFFNELNDFLKGYNLNQKKAIVSKKEKILCIAGAGTGKTSVLTKRIEFLNKYEKIKGEKILAITFTRRARDEMKKRLNSFGVEAVIETFNSFSEKILLKHQNKIYKRKMRVANSKDKMVAVLRALDSMNLEFEEVLKNYFTDKDFENKNIYELQASFVADCFNVLDFFKLKEKRPSETDFHTKNQKLIFKVVTFLEKYLQLAGLRTYTDQLIDTINFFSIHKKFIPEFEHILVDEFQDVNAEQMKLLRLLSPKNLFCVGDPRQSIFGWRGSDIKYIQEFQKENNDVEIIYLNENYRSSKEIINLMNESIKQMNLPDLKPTINEPCSIELKKFPSKEEEFEFVANEILNSKIDKSEIFVLGRTNNQLYDLAKILRKKGIKFVMKKEEENGIGLKKDEVVLGTVHSIKGLESEAVFLIGATSSNFPCKYSEHPVVEGIKIFDYDKEAEERRLFYVAISRAKRKLVMTYTGKNPTYFINEKMRTLLG